MNSLPRQYSATAVLRQRLVAIVQKQYLAVTPRPATIALATTVPKRCLATTTADAADAAAPTDDEKDTIAGPLSSSVRAFSTPTLRRVTKNYSRYYEVNGQPNLLFPSVTSVLNVLDKPGLSFWSVKQALGAATTEITASQQQAGPRPLTEAEIQAAIDKGSLASKKVLGKAGDFGTRAHDVIDQLIAGIRGDDLSVDEDVKQVVKNFWDYWVESGVTLDPRGDTMVYSPRYGYAGALDALALSHDGKLMVCDWKTSNAVYDSHIMQVAAYAKAAEENLLAAGCPPDQAKVHRACVVRFEKGKPGYEVHEVENIDAAFAAFKAALYLFHYRSTLMKKT
jgi:hypothetical protein